MKVERNMPADAYHAFRGASASRLKAIRRSPAHLRMMDEEPLKASALVVGEAFHTMVLEPYRFTEQFACAPSFDRRTLAGKAAYQTWLDSLRGEKVLSEDEWLSVTGMGKAVGEHPVASDLLLGRTETEISLFWEEIGIPCKARIDAYNLDQRCIIDLKSTQDASPEEFPRSVAKFAYHIQAAWYLRAMRAAGFEVETMVFIAVEKSHPYGVACYCLDDATIAEGEREIARLLPIMSNCLQTGNWHGYDPTIRTIGLPRWAVRGEEASL